MTPKNKSQDREEMLADIAEMYYQEGKTQAEISVKVGMTRSAISRMLTEARQKGIVEIHVHRPLRYHPELENKLKHHFNLIGARVITHGSNLEYDELKKRLGNAAAIDLSALLRPKMIIGVAWGTTVKSVIDALSPTLLPGTQVVQLLGILGSIRHSYSGQTLVESLAYKLGGEGFYLYAPFMVDTEDTATVLKNDLSIKKALSLGTQSDLAILGVGSVKPDFCSLYQGDHISRQDLRTLTAQNVVGDVSGHYFDIYGQSANVEFHKRLMGICKEDLLKIPVRFGTAGNPEKAEAVLGALRGSYINYLTTDSQTAARILELAESQ
ncbi:MAG: sugar-binding transcriptional regulator [Anaerolineales bacterium]|nr:sugar-binding transcriptional regulator [Anaerolineales bacterium]